MKELKQRLRKKGLSEYEIEKTISSFKKAEINKHRSIRNLESIIFWVALPIMILSNIVVAIGIIPLVMVLSNQNLYIIIIIIGLVLGMLFNFLMNEMAHLETHHHLITAIFIPIIATLSLFIITTFSNYLVLALGMDISIDKPLVVGLIYSVSLSLPYIISKVEKLMH